MQEMHRVGTVQFPFSRSRSEPNLMVITECVKTKERAVAGLSLVVQAESTAAGRSPSLVFAEEQFQSRSHGW